MDVLRHRCSREPQVSARSYAMPGTLGGRPSSTRKLGRVAQSQVIPEGAGRVKGHVCPVFLGFPAGFEHAGLEPCRWRSGLGCVLLPWSLPSRLSGRAGQGPGRARLRGGAAGVLEVAGRDPIMGRQEARGMELCSGPWCSLCCGQAPGCGHPLGGSHGCRPRGHGAVRVRAAGSIRATAGPAGDARARYPGESGCPRSLRPRIALRRPQMALMPSLAFARGV